MEQNIIECLQGLQLTKEKEEDISISSASRSELLEEWSLSFFWAFIIRPTTEYASPQKHSKISVENGIRSSNY